MQELEQWKKIKGMGRGYRISDRGRILRDAYTGENTRGIRFRYPERELKGFTMKGRGRCISLVGPDGLQQVHMVSRLVLKHFGSKPESLKRLPYSALIVEYLDGDNTNLHISNLRWITKSQMFERVYRQNKEFMERKLQESGIPREVIERYGILTKNRITKAVQHHSSLQAAALWLNISYGTLYNNLVYRGLSGQAHTSDYIVKLDDGNRWPRFSKDPAAFIERTRSNTVRLYTANGKKEKVFPSVLELASHLGVPPKSLYSRIRESNGQTIEYKGCIIVPDGIQRCNLFSEKTLNS